MRQSDWDHFPSIMQQKDFSQVYVIPFQLPFTRVEVNLAMNSDP